MKKEIKKQIEKPNKNKVDYKWVFIIIIITFFISIVLSGLSEIIIKNVSIYIAIIILVIFIGLGVLFDMIGVAVTSADEEPFHSMSSRKVKGAKHAVYFKKNADKVSSFCNDVIGDICGIISGGVGVTIAIYLSKYIDSIIATLLITAIIASLTIGCKALGKTLAINKSNEILYRFSKFLSIIKQKK